MVVTRMDSALAEQHQLEAIEVDLLLTAVAKRYGYDFRGYARPSMIRRIRRALQLEGAPTLSALQERLLRWNEADLDSTRLPHPLMGRMTVREVLHFTVYHNLHHVHAAARRRAG